MLFAWCTNDPPLHAGYRVERKFKAAAAESDQMDMMTSGERMYAIGIIQNGDLILTIQA
jgi:hypothetical protein